MRIPLSLGGAFIGLMAGVGFASGQEVIQFFSSYGWKGIAGAIVAAILFSFFSINLYTIGCTLKTQSHAEAIHYICGPQLGKIVDILLTFFLFGIVIVMLAGAGSSAHQQLGISPYIGSAISGIITIGLVFLGLKKVISIMSWITPVLALMILIIAIYAISHIQLPFSELTQIIETQPKASNNWFLSALLYVSYNIAGLTAMLVVMGGNIRNIKDAKLGGIFGGMGIGLLITCMTIVFIASANIIKGVDIPTLFLGNLISPWFGIIVLIFLQIKLIITCMGLTYAFAARCNAYGMNFKVATVACIVIAYIASTLGFVKLVGLVYPIMGYLGFVIMLCITIKWFKLKKKNSMQSLSSSTNL